MSLNRLSELKPGAAGIISRFEENERKIKLMEMGCIPGESLKVENVAPLGDPIAIEIAGYSLSLRKSDARYIWIDTFPETLN